MSEARVEVSKEMDFPPASIYAVLADYQRHHPKILPRQYFTDLEFVEGGQGAGTQVQVRMRVMGVEREFLMTIAEPEPGRVLTETDDESGVVTTFTVEPGRDGQTSPVTIASRFTTGPGLAGLMEKVGTQTITRRIYKEELELLERYLRSIQS
jgi:hypothetical protein